jgi:hypothetical protein
MRRPALALSAAAAAALLAACGASASGTVSPSMTLPASTSGSASASASAAPATPMPSLPAGCHPPAQDLDFANGSATLDITSGPGQGHYNLAIDRTESSYTADNKELKGRWTTPDEKVFLEIDVEGTDPCQPDAFTRIGTEGPSGEFFPDGSHTDCQFSLPSLSTAGAQGKTVCTHLGGGGAGVFIDATGTFTLQP